MKETLAEPIASFRLPRFSEITNVGLYLEQVTRFVNTYLLQIGAAGITPSMVSNYAKQKTIPGPVKKAYSAESIAYLIFVACVKNVMTMEDIRLIERLQRELCPAATAYDYFCAEFENVLQYVFGMKPELAQVSDSLSPVKALVRSAILSAAHKIYLDSCLRALREE